MRPNIKKNTAIIPLIAVLLSSAPLLWGHGIAVSLEEKPPCVIANARYHGSKALANARVTIAVISFSGESTEFQTGSTDRNGNFCFLPDKPGTWTVLVDDLTGHRGKKSITLGDDFFTPPTPPVVETGAAPTPPASVTAKAEISPPAEVISPSKDAKPVPVAPTAPTAYTPEKKEPASGSGEFCCYLLKIILGAVLILVITYGLYRVRKRREAGK